MARSRPTSLGLDLSRSRAAVVVGTSRKHATVRFDDGQEQTVQLAPALAREQQTAVAVGDDVQVAQGVLYEVGERRSVLSRPDPQDPRRERVLVANVDVVVAVLAVRDPPLRLRLVDRLCIAILRGGARPIVVISKVDAADDATSTILDDLRAVYPPLGVPVVATSTATGEGLAALRDLLEGKLAAFVGQSGVGKSSLVNALAGSELARTGATSASTSKGRHTTTSSSLIQIGGGITIVDTPGVRSFGLYKMEPVEVASWFPDFAGHHEQCRWTGCLHRPNDDGCAVLAAVARGDIHARRYDAYVRILDSLDEDGSPQ